MSSWSRPASKSRNGVSDDEGYDAIHLPHPIGHRARCFPAPEPSGVQEALDGGQQGLLGEGLLKELPAQGGQLLRVDLLAGPA
jgi:hypothetical protein